MIGNRIYALAQRLWSINRSLTGDGVRETLNVIKERLPALVIHEIPSGTPVYDWVVPKEWKVGEAFILDPAGKKIADFSVNNLHLVGYSVPVNRKMPLAELQEHLYSLPDQPTAVPYVTSYYQERWGFCLSQIERDALPEGEYEVFIDSALFDGYMTYGELLLPGKSEKEVFVSTYVCHPSMANNELSGPCVTAFLADYLSGGRMNRWSYRFVFIPETIGSIAYLSRNLDRLKSNVIAGFNVSCVGDDRHYSYLPSRNGKTMSDDVARHVLKSICPGYVSYTWADRGSDERQYCAPGVDLPIASIMRTKYGRYEEYHTSLDDLNRVVTPEGLAGGYHALFRAIEAIEHHCYPKVTVLGEPQLGKRGLYPTLSTRSSGAEVQLMMNLITWSDGTKSLLEIAELCEAPIWELYPLIEKLLDHRLLDLLNQPLENAA